jgi:hypothetical protein
MGTKDMAIHCLDQAQSRIRPVGHGLILTHGRLIVLIVARLWDGIIPSPTGRFPFFARIPGNPAAAGLLATFMWPYRTDDRY